MNEEDYLLEKVELAKKITSDCIEFLEKVGDDSLCVGIETSEATLTTDKSGKVCYGKTLRVDIQSWVDEEDED